MISLDDAPELARFQDQPAQLPAASPGKVGALRLGFERRDGRTILADLHRQAPLLVQQALYWDEAMPELACVMMICTSGGTLQGDRYTIDVTLGPGSRAHLTTQSATKIQEMDANYASQVQHLALADDAYLEYLPDPVIPYRHSRFVGRTVVSIAESATLLYAEILLPGRFHYGDGELFAYDLYSSGLTAVRPDGRELFVDKFVIQPEAFRPDNRAVMGDYRVLANVFLLTPPEQAERVLERTPPTFGVNRIAAGASRLPNDAGLVYRVLGDETEPVRATVREFWALARGEVMGRPLMPPFGWRG